MKHLVDFLKVLLLVLFLLSGLPFDARTQGIILGTDDPSGLTETGISSLPYYLGPTHVCLEKGKTCLFGWYTMGLNEDSCPDSVMRGWHYLYIYSHPERRWVSLASWTPGHPPDTTFFSDNSCYPQQGSLFNYLYIQTDNIPVGDFDSCFYMVCGELSPGGFGVRTCAGTKALYFHVIPYSFSLLSAVALNGSMQNVMLTWGKAEVTHWNLHHYAIFRNDADSVSFDNLPDCLKVADAIPADDTTELITVGNRGISSFYAVAGIDSLGEVVALSSSMKPDYVHETFSLNTPTDGSVSHTLIPIFSWEENNEPYELWIGTSPDFSGCMKFTGINETHFTLTSPLEDHGFYYWKVMNADSLFSDETGWAFGTNVVNDAPGHFSLLSPAPASVQTVNPINFTWTPSSDPGDSICYHIVVSHDPSFTDTIFQSLVNNNFLLSGQLLPEDTQIWWKILARDPGENTTVCDAISPFTINRPEPPGDFTLVSPVYSINSLATETSLYPVFRWRQSVDPDPGDVLTYTLVYSQNSQFSDPVEITGLTDTLYTQTVALQEDSYYYWKVKVSDSQGHEKWNNGQPYLFVTNSQDQQPQPFAFVRPLPDQNLPEGDYFFQWTRPVDDNYDYHQYELLFSSDSLFSDADTVFFNETDTPGFNAGQTTDSTLTASQMMIPSGDLFFRLKCKSKTAIPNEPLTCYQQTGTGWSDILCFHPGSDTTITDPYLASYTSYWINLDTVQGSVLYRVKWNYSNVSHVRIEYTLNNGINWTVLEDSIPAQYGPTGQYFFRMPVVLTNEFRLRISSLENDRAYDISRKPITVIVPVKQINVLNPKGGDSLKVTSPCVLNWTSQNVDSVTVMISYDGGTNWETLANKLPPVYWLNWTVPNHPSDSCLIKVTDYFYPLTSDLTDSLFTIYPLRTIHVSKDGNDQTGNGSAVLPFLTIQKAMDEYHDYDSIKIASGIYPETVTFPQGKSIWILRGGYDPFSWEPSVEGNTIIRSVGGTGITAAGTYMVKMCYAYLRDLVIRSATTGIFCSGKDHLFNLRNVRFDTCTTAISLDGPGIEMNGCSIFDCITGISFSYPFPQKITVDNCLFHNITVNSVLGYSPATVEIRNSTFSGSTRHIFFAESYNQPITIKNNIFTHSANAIRIINASFTETNNCFYNNQVNIFSNLQTQVPHMTDVLGNPFFVDPSSDDFHLEINSPCIGAGSANSLEKDLDGNLRPFPLGSFPDIGSYENPLGSPVQPTVRYWTGVSDDRWENSDNWDPSGLPAIVDTIIIPANILNFPVIRFSGMTGSNVFINDNALLEIKPDGALILKGDLFIGGMYPAILRKILEDPWYGNSGRNLESIHDPLPDKVR